MGNRKILSSKQRNKVKLSLLTVLCNATQIYRGTIPKNKKRKFQKHLKKIIGILIKKVDNNTINNISIRNHIQKLHNFSGVSIGGCQKAVNVYLKFYCVVSNKSDRIIRELDCPIDSFVLKDNKIKKVSLRKMQGQYKNIQDILGKKHKIKILTDIKAWDKKKIY